MVPEVRRILCNTLGRNLLVEAGLVVTLRRVSENSLHLVVDLLLLAGLLYLFLLQSFLVERASSSRLLSLDESRLFVSGGRMLVDHPFNSSKVVVKFVLNMGFRRSFRLRLAVIKVVL